MTKKPLTFELSYKDKTTMITELHLPAGVSYFIQTAQSLPFFITKNKEEKKWVSTPPGHQHVAQEIGALIDEYLKKNKRKPKS